MKEAAAAVAQRAGRRQLVARKRFVVRKLVADRRAAVRKVAGRKVGAVERRWGIARRRKEMQLEAHGSQLHYDHRWKRWRRSGRW